MTNVLIDFRTDDISGLGPGPGQWSANIGVIPKISIKIGTQRAVNTLTLMMVTMREDIWRRGGDKYKYLMLCSHQGSRDPPALVMAS